MLLDIRNISKTFQGENITVRAVQDISLRLNAGELIAVNGPSGCGKTTLLLIAGGLLYPDNGEVEICNANLYHLSPEQRTRKRAVNIGFVFQQFHLLPYLDILQNVMVPCLGFSSATGERARELVDKFNLTSRMHHKPSQLSTGEKQRVALVRALMNNPAILFADEPTGNLDDDNAREVMHSFTAFKEEGGAVMLVSHDQRTSLHADKTYYMKEGRFIRECI